MYQRPLNDASSLYPEVVRKVPVNSPKHYNNNRIRIYYRSLIMVNAGLKQRQVNSNKKVSGKNND